ncbi:MAG: aminopeptidase P family protein [Actinomycetota bacterium]|nr:aminopeptidase P family protein [Actinomycetota bacterium]
MSAPADRRDRLRAELPSLGVEAALITRLVNVRYLTGLASSNTALLISCDGTDLLATDGRYATLAGQVAGDVELVVERSVATVLAERAVATDRRTIAVETHDVSVDLHEALQQAAPSVRWSSLHHAVERLRTTKDDAEIELLRHACAITDRAFAEVLPVLRPGLSERMIARLLESAMIDAGADAPAFETIVAAGPSGALPHHRPSDRLVERGELVTMDFGARYRGYHADMTRTVAVGPPPGWAADVYALVGEAQRAGCTASRPGVDARELDTAARTVIADAGQAAYFPHGLGHGVGLEIHEAPLIGYRATGTIEARTPLTIEPGIYLPGRGGVRIEDTLVVRDGEPDLLTHSPRDLLVLG